MKFDNVFFINGTAYAGKSMTDNIIFPELALAATGCLDQRGVI